MDIAILAGNVLISTAYVLLCSGISKKYAKNAADHQLFNMVCFLCAAAVMLVIFLLYGNYNISLITLLIGAGYGIANGVTSVSRTQAMENGPVSFVNILINGSAIMIPTVFSVLIYSEKTAFYKYIGMVLLLAAIVIAVLDKNDKSSGRRWILYTVLAMLGAGAIGVLQKTHQNTDYAAEIMAVILISFLFSALYSLVYLFIYRRKGIKAMLTVSLKSRAGRLMIVCGILVALINAANTYLAGALPGVIVFPVTFGGEMLLLLVASVLLLKERLSPVRWIGVAVGMAAIAMLCIG